MAAQILFERIREEIPGAQAAAIGSVREGTFVTRRWEDHDLGPLERPLRELVRAWTEMYEGLGGPVDFGSNDEVLVSASRGYLLVRVHHASGRFVAVLLSADGNIGYLRFKIRDYLRAALAE